MKTYTFFVFALRKFKSVFRSYTLKAASENCPIEIFPYVYVVSVLLFNVSTLWFKFGITIMTMSPVSVDMLLPNIITSHKLTFCYPFIPNVTHILLLVFKV